MVYYGIASFQITHWRTLRNLEIKEYLFFVLPYGKDREVTGITAAFENLSYIYIASICIYRNNRKDSTNKRIRRSFSRQHEEGDETRFGSFYR